MPCFTGLRLPSVVASLLRVGGCCGLLLQVIKETHGFYTSLKSGARPNSEELSLV